MKIPGLKKLTSAALIALFVPAVFMLCTNNKPAVAKTQNHGDSAPHRTADLAKLHDMACKLRLGMPKADVESELGKPRYSPATGVFYYDWDATDDRGVPLGIVVEYRRQSTSDSGKEEYTGKLESYTVGRIAE